MTDKELVWALRRIAADNHRCLGCGYEHNCSIYGCRIIKAAADTIARLSEHVGQVEQERDAAIADIRHIVCDLYEDDAFCARSFAKTTMGFVVVRQNLDFMRIVAGLNGVEYRRNEHGTIQRRSNQNY